MSDSTTNSAPAAPSKSYPASCHCQAIQFTITQSPPLDDPTLELMSCNCSICARNGYLFLFQPDANLTFQKGSLEEMTAYFWATKRMPHYFCGTCGASCFAKSVDANLFPGMVAVNARMLHDVELKDIKVKHMDGKSWNPEV